MSNLDKNASKKASTARLGRGLGSLLSPQSFDVSEPTEPVPTTVKERPPSAVTTPSMAPDPSGPVQSAAPGAMKEVKEENRVWHVPIDKVVPHGDQPRKDFPKEELAELAQSIKKQGIIQPITVRKTAQGLFEIVAGERRWRAAQAAGLHEVPVLIRQYDKQTSLEVALIENIQRQNLNPVEEAEAYHHLIDKYHLTQQQLADQVGKERATIANFLRLLSLAPEVREYLKSGMISMGHAKALLVLSDEAQQRQLAKKIINLRLTVRAAERLASQVKEGARESKDVDMGMDVSRRLVQKSAQELQRLMGRKVGIDYKNGKGKIQVHFYSDDELSEIIEKIKDSWKKLS